MEQVLLIALQEFPHGELPTPAPLPEAVEAGLFGSAELPSADNVRSITLEQARELYWIRCECLHLAECIGRRANPRTGRISASREKRDELAVKLSRELEQSQNRYADVLVAYADGFGLEAAEALDQFVRKNCPEVEPEPAPLVQQSLF